MDQVRDVSSSDFDINEDNILMSVDARSREDVIRQLGTLLEKNGYVKDTFTEAVLQREVVFPTGLQTSVMGFAIPHTDTEHVKRSAVAIAALSRPVAFQAMGNPDQSVPVDVVMMLAVRDPKMVVHVLRRVLSILEDEEALHAFRKAESRQEVREIVEAHIQKTE